MRTVSDMFLAAVRGSNSPVVTADVWLGGDIVRAGIGIAGGQLTFDSTRDVEGALSIVLLDDESDGSALSKVIHAIGMRMNVRAGFELADSTETVSMGWFDIYDVKSVDAWQWFDWNLGEDGEPIGVKTSSVVSVEALDFMSVVANSPFLVATQPTAGADAWATIQNLCTGIVSVLDPGLPAKTIPAGLVFEWDRLAAIKQIAALWGAVKPVMTPDNQLTLVYTSDAGDVIADFGVKINIAAWQDSSNSADLHNGVTFLGKTPDGIELVGTATESSGLSAWGGNYGYRPLRASSDLMSTQAMVDAAAATRLETEIKSRAVTQTVDALWNPAVELRDQPKLILPDRKVNTQVLGMTLPLTKGAMSVTLRLPVTL